MTDYPRERIERAARIYRTAQDAARALGIHAGSFNRLCAQYGIETPNQRKKRKRTTHTELLRKGKGRYLEDQDSLGAPISQMSEKQLAQLAAARERSPIARKDAATGKDASE
uniref:Uncharacterized protein n=1 Tax=viral metagenome TaxID=1070528 RepID=A0A6M3XNX9_9ZZZZ